MMVKEPLDELTDHLPTNVHMVTGSPTSPLPPTSSFHSSSSWSQSPTHSSPLASGSASSTNPRTFSSSSSSSSSSHASSAWVPSATASPFAPTTPAVNMSYELDDELLSKELYHLAIATALTLLVGLIQVRMSASLRLWLIVDIELFTPQGVLVTWVGNILSSHVSCIVLSMLKMLGTKFEFCAACSK